MKEFHRLSQVPNYVAYYNVTGYQLADRADVCVGMYTWVLMLHLCL